MKAIQKISLALLILIGVAIKSNAQNQIEIVIVGSAHNNSKSSQDFQSIINKLKNFKPDMVFGEYLPPADYATLPENHWAKKLSERATITLKNLTREKLKTFHRELPKTKKRFLHSPIIIKRE